MDTGCIPAQRFPSWDTCSTPGTLLLFYCSTQSLQRRVVSSLDVQPIPGHASLPQDTRSIAGLVPPRDTGRALPGAVRGRAGGAPGPRPRESRARWRRCRRQCGSGGGGSAMAEAAEAAEGPARRGKRTGTEAGAAADEPVEAERAARRRRRWMAGAGAEAAIVSGTAMGTGTVMGTGSGTGTVLGTGAGAGRVRSALAAVLARPDPHPPPGAASSRRRTSREPLSCTTPSTTARSPCQVRHRERSPPHPRPRGDGDRVGAVPSCIGSAHC